MPYQSNQIVADLQHHKRFLDHEYDRLGWDLCEMASESAAENIHNQCSPNGDPWPDLLPKYAAWKSKHYPGRPMGILEFVMAQWYELMGEVVVSPNAAVVTCGVTEEARAHAVSFQEGVKNTRPDTIVSVPRPQWLEDLTPTPRVFWGLNLAALGRIAQYLDDRFRRIVS